MTPMFTTCAACRMNLAVTPSDLRIGQGYVRCGRCNRVFNALLSLSEDMEEAEPVLSATGTTSVPALEDPGEEAPDDAPPSVNEIPEPPADEDASWMRRVTDGAVDVVETQPTGTFETIVLEGDSCLRTEEHVDEKVVDAQLQEFARQIDTRNANADADEAASKARAAGQPAEDIVLEGDAGTEGPELDADAAVGNPPRRHWIWALAATVLALLLAGQLVHHNRQVLVAHPWFERPMQSLYAMFGVALEPRWDLAAYDLRQLGAEAPPGASDRIMLKAAVQNRSTNKQPPPVIRVVLQDRFGNAVSTTDITPAQYLGGAAPARMAPDQRLDLMLTLSDPARQAAGFEIDACLPVADGRLHCGNNP